MVTHCAEHFGDRAFQLRAGVGDAEHLTFAQFAERVQALATGLADLGVAPGDTVGLIAHNRPEWLLADLAILSTGAADVPRGADLSPKEIAAILGHAEVIGTFVEDPKMLKRLREALGDLPQLRFAILLTGTADEAGGKEGEFGLTIDDVIERGRGLLAQGDTRVATALAGITPDTLATIIYTSGTSGEPKGVRLLHRNLVSNIVGLPAVIQITADDIYLSVLPAWHAFERMIDYVLLYAGAQIAYSSPARKIFMRDLAAIKPTVLAAVPRLWEAMVDAAATQARKQGHEKAFNYFVEASIKSVKCKRRLAGTDALPPATGTRLGWFSAVFGNLWYGLLHRIAQGKIFQSVRDRFGGRVRCMISGGGALPAAVDDFFVAADLPILEGYGLTETSPVLTLRSVVNPLARTVGEPMPETQFKLVDPEGNEVAPHTRGRILVKGPQIMQGYHKREDLTKAVLSEDGWFDTGDLGLITLDGSVRIVGRAKDTIVLRSGENVEPEPIEIRLRESHLIDHVVVMGQDESVLGALVVPSADALGAKLGIEKPDCAKVAAHPGAADAIRDEVNRLLTIGAGFKRHEKVGKIAILPREFEVGRELTPTLKVKRPVVRTEYRDAIVGLFGEEAAAKQ
jgi:long-chain acyl-CoA synthetase